MTQSKINEIEKALRLHINYKGVSSGSEYLRIMDRLSYNFTGAPAIKVSKLIDSYLNEVGLNSLNEAFERLRKQDKINENN